MKTFDDAVIGLLFDLEQHVDTHGWDQPGLIWTIRAADTNVGDDDAWKLTVELHDVAVDVVDALVGNHIPDDTIGAVVVLHACAVEGPGVTVRPVADPSETADQRIVLCALRDGTCAGVARHRDTDPVLLDVSGPSERLHATVRRYVGLPSGCAEPPTVGNVLCRAAAQFGCGFAASVVDDPNATAAFCDLLEGGGNPVGAELAELVRNDPLLAVDAAWTLFADTPLNATFETHPDLAALGASVPSGGLEALAGGDAVTITWAELRRHAAENGNTFASWADDNLYAWNVNSMVRSSDDTRGLLRLLDAHGLDPEAVATLDQLLDHSTAPEH